MRSGMRGLLHWTLAVLTVASVLPAGADEPSAADVAGARVLALEGIKLANAGNCKDAVEKLARAESLHAAPTILGRLGECQVAIGKLVEGTENLRRVVREPLPSGAPPAFARARARAERLLTASARRVAHLHIVLNAPPEAKVALTVDGEPVRAELVGADRPTDPGAHLVEATAPGYMKASENVSLLEGAAATVTITLKADPNAKTQEQGSSSDAARQAVLPTPSAGLPSPAASGPSRVPALAAFAAGGIGLAVGGVLGLIALGEHGSLDTGCNSSKVCPSSEQGTLDSLRATSAGSTIGFIVGGVGVAAGVVLLFVPSAHSGPKAEQGLVLEPYVAPTGAGLAGRF
jgi:hypothetical protein